ncbi:hypothetical protein ACFL0Y_04580 [Patescibacteria group bacterium]
MAENENGIGRAPKLTLNPPSGEWGLTSMLGLRGSEGNRGADLSREAVKGQPRRPRLTLNPPSGDWVLTHSIQRPRS